MQRPFITLSTKTHAILVQSYCHGNQEPQTIHSCLKVNCTAVYYTEIDVHLAGGRTITMPIHRDALGWWTCKHNADTHANPHYECQ